MAASDIAKKLFRLSACLYLLFLAQLAVSVAAVAGPNDDGVIDHAKFKILVESFARAWNRADLAGLVLLFGEEGLLLTPVGAGTARQEIRNRFGPGREGRLRGTRLDAQMSAVDFPTDNIAVLEGNYRLTGVQGRGSVAGPFLFRLERNDNGWKITRARLYRFTERGLALRDAHNDRYPFVEGAASEALAMADSAKFSERQQPAEAAWAEADERVAIGR